MMFARALETKMRSGCTAVSWQAHVERSNGNHAYRAPLRVNEEAARQVQQRELVFRCRRRSQVYLPTYKLVSLAVIGKLAELLVGQLGNDLGCHALIIHDR